MSSRTIGIHAGRRVAGFTLIELMVALGLAAIISVSIMMISQQARQAYEQTVKKVDVYNRFRYALRSLEEDLKNWIPTGDLEFYQDGKGRSGRLNAHWDPGEEVQDTTDELGAGVRDGGEYRRYEEFASIEERHYYSKESPASKPKRHDAYRIYFQTMTYIDGAVRLANVEYFLADPLKNRGTAPRLPIPDGTRSKPVQPENVADISLVKVIRYYDVTPGLIIKKNVTPVKRKWVEIATNVTDFRLEYTLEPGLNVGRRDTVNFYTPSSEAKKPYERSFAPKFDKGRGSFLKRFGYGSVDLEVNYPKANGFPGARGDRNVGFNAGEHRPTTFGFRGNRNVQFAQLVPGDNMFVFVESDTGGDGGNAGQQNTSFKRVKPGDYTVKANRAGELEFMEDMDSTDWNGQTQSGILYKAAFLPAAVRITLRVVNDDGQNPKTFQKVVWVRRRSR